jgi:hypothetical protein
MKEKNRNRVIEEVKENLLQRSLPRFLMTLMILLTGMAGFLASFVMLHLGLEKMWLRYPLAILVSYIVFLLLLKIWLWLQEPKDVPSLDGDFSVADFDFGSSSGSSSSGGDLFSFDFGIDLDDGAILILVLIVLAMVLFALVYVVYIAPVLLAEILVDGLVISSLSLGLKETDRQHWLSSVLKRTWIPLIIIVALFVIAGATLQTTQPEARSIVEWWNGK